VPLSGSQVTLNWTDNSPNETGLTIERSTDGKTFTPVGSVGTDIATFTDGGLNGSTTYFYQVLATNGAGSSKPSDRASVTTPKGIFGGLDFSKGFAGSSSVLTLNGSAAIAGSPLELTDGGVFEAASAFTDNKLDVASFSTEFAFQLTNAVADGFTFTIHGQGPTALGPFGAALGYGDGSNGIVPSVAVKFDLFNDEDEGNDSTGLYTDGAFPALPAIDLTNTGINRRSGDVFDVAMTYDGITLNVTITDTTTPAAARLSSPPPSSRLPMLN
jgi:hypothetical protein